MRGKRTWLAAVACSMVLAAAPLEARERLEESGDVLYVAMPLAALALTFARRDLAGSAQFGKSLAVAGLATGLTKEVVNKSRPDGSDDTAFVSGHSSAAFLSAGFIHRRYGIGNAWPAYVLASYVGWTRIYADRHDLIDVLGGAAVGVGSAFWLSERMPDTMTAAVAPTPDGDGIVIRFSGTFGRRSAPGPELRRVASDPGARLDHGAPRSPEAKGRSRAASRSTRPSGRATPPWPQAPGHRPPPPGVRPD